MTQSNAFGDKIPTGIPIIDQMLDGGVPRGSVVLIRASPLADPAALLIQYLYNRLKEGDIGVYYVNNKNPSSILEDSSSTDMNLEPFKRNGQLFFVDAYSALFGLKSEEAYSITKVDDIKETSIVISKAISECAKKGKVFLVYDSLNTSYDQQGNAALEEIKNWAKIALTYDAILCFNYTDWNYPTEVSKVINELFPNVIDLLTLERIVGTNVITVTKLQGAQVMSKKLIPIKKSVIGGVKGYIPKILVTGPFHAGKTTIVHTLSKRAVSVQRMETTVALDFGHVDYRGFTLDLFGTIGQPRFDPILERLGGEALGVLLVVDSTKPEEFARAKEMMRKANVYGLPYVIVANKQDLPDALSVEEIKKKFDVPDEVSVVGVVGTDKGSVLKALDRLLDKIVLA